MIERIDSGMMVLRPITRIGQQTKNISIEVKPEAARSADYLYNPDLADKINASRESVKEEMNVLREANLQTRAKQGDDRQQDEESSSASSLDLLKRSMTRMESLLYQVASVVAADPDSLEAIQRKLVEELRGYKRIFEGVKLPETMPADLKLDDIDISGKLDVENVSSASASDARKAISSAEDVVDRMLGHVEEEMAEQSMTEAVLSTMNQNLAAAESALYPEEIMSRAREASLSLQDRMLEAYGAHAHLQPDQVFKLVSPG